MKFQVSSLTTKSSRSGCGGRNCLFAAGRGCAKVKDGRQKGDETCNCVDRYGSPSCAQSENRAGLSRSKGVKRDSKLCASVKLEVDVDVRIWNNGR